MMQSAHFGGPWTKEKLESLSKYLHAYTTIFNRNPRARFFTTYYVDAFAGTGRVTIQGDSQTLLFPEFAEPDTQEYLKGSATRALEVEPGFKRYLFIERDPARCRELERLKVQFPHKAASIHIENEEANRYLVRWCRTTDWSRVRAVVFLDPFGMQVSWSLLTQIAQTKGVDLWLLFPLGIGVTRLLTRKAPPPPAWADRLTNILGTDEWKGAFYQKKTVSTLFGNQELEEKEADYDLIGSFFLNRLATIFEGVAKKPLILRNSRSTPLYLFCFAAGNKRGASTAVRIAEDIIGAKLMATNSRIEWTEMTWNPVTGCSKVSQGCKNCYAERMAKRLQSMGMERYRNAFSVTLQEDLLELPLQWKSPRLIFVNSMSDLFHEQVPLEYIQRVFAVMEQCPRHTFQVLTKRSGRLRDVASFLHWPMNVWMGVSVENVTVVSRVIDLQGVSASVRFLSVEPLLGPIEDLPLDGISWVIVGGESGPNARPMREEWVQSILRQCRIKNVAFFFKQWGGTRKHRTGRVLNGEVYDEMPAVLLSAATG